MYRSFKVWSQSFDGRLLQGAPLHSPLKHSPHCLWLLPSLEAIQRLSLSLRNLKCCFSLKSMGAEPLSKSSRAATPIVKREHTINSFYWFPKFIPYTEQMGSDFKRLNFHFTAPFIALKSLCHLSLVFIHGLMFKALACPMTASAGLLSAR